MLQEDAANLGDSAFRIAGVQDVQLPAGRLRSDGQQKKEIETVVESRKLDYELLDRWIKYMDKPTESTSTKKPGRP